MAVFALWLSQNIWWPAVKSVFLAEFTSDVSHQLNMRLRATLQNHESVKLADKIIEQSRSQYPANADEAVISRQKNFLAGCVDTGIKTWLDLKTPEQYERYSEDLMEATLRPIIQDCLTKSEDLHNYGSQ